MRRELKNPYFMVCLSSSAYSCVSERKITRETHNLKVASSNPAPPNDQALENNGVFKVFFMPGI